MLLPSIQGSLLYPYSFLQVMIALHPLIPSSFPLEGGKKEEGMRAIAYTSPLQ